MLSSLPKPLSLQDATVTPSGGRLQPIVAGNSLSVVLAQEVQRFNRLLAALVVSLDNVIKGVRGLVVMSGELEEVSAAVLEGRVPEAWTRLAYPSLKPLAGWCKDLGDRVAFFRSWLTEGQPHAYWLPAFFFPQGFLTGALQMHARKTLVPIDDLGFDFEVVGGRAGGRTGTRKITGDPAAFDPLAHGCTDPVTEGPENGIYLYGIFIDSGRWDSEAGVLVDAAPRRMYERLPTVHFDIVSLAEGANTRGAGTYEAPLYKEALRKGVLSTTGRSSNYVLSIRLRTRENPDHFVRRGTALLLALAED
jgi:dynein heavy chain